VNIVSDVIKWPHSELGKVERSLSSYRTIQQWRIPPLVDSSFYLALVAFREKLIFWDEYLGTEGRSHFMPPLEVLRRNLIYGPEFPAHVKDCIEASLRQSTSFVPCDLIDADDSAWGFDYFFPPRDMINFEIKDDHSDILRVLEEPPDINPTFLDAFASKARDYIRIPPGRVYMDDLDKLGTFTSTSTFVKGSSKTHRTSNYKARLGRSFVEPGHLQFQYCHVQKNPAEARAAVVGTPETINSIKKFHKMFKAVAHCPEDHYSDPKVTSGLERWLTSYSKRVGYVMSDIKKSGLTFSRRIHDVIIDILDEAMPDWGWGFYKGYGNATIDIPGLGVRPMKNGYGLGMMDCVISFTQAVIYNMVVDDHPDVNMFKLEGKFWSDDSVIRAQMRADVELQPDALQGIMVEFNRFASQTGIVIHDKKPYVSQVGVFLEFYGAKSPNWNTQKCGQYIGCLFETLKACDIARAKEIFACLALEVPKSLNRWLSYALSKIIDFWGYEFSRDECDLPFEAGGWSYYIEEGYNSFFHVSQLMEETSDRCALVGICSMRAPPTRKLKLHKEHSDYISDIISMGWAGDPSKLSWMTIAKGTLLIDYKSKTDVVLLRKKILKKRIATFEKRKVSKNTEYFELQRFWDMVCEYGWYLPPMFAVERQLAPQPQVPKTARKRDCFEGLSDQRLYFWLTRLRKSRLDICLPGTDETSVMDVASTLLYRVSGGHHRTLYECAHVIQTGYDLASVYEALNKKLGGFFKFKVNPPEVHEIVELLQDAMGSCHGNVFPWHERGQSFLTRLSPADMELNRFRSMPEGLALYYSQPESGDADPSLAEGGAYVYIKELHDKLHNVAEEKKPLRPLTSVLPSEKDFSLEEIQQLRYYQSMMKGALGHLAMAFSGHTTEDIIHPGVESYTSIFDDSDDEGIGTMFQ
jgi:hypothetical protein